MDKNAANGPDRSAADPSRDDRAEDVVGWLIQWLG